MTDKSAARTVNLDAAATLAPLRDRNSSTEQFRLATDAAFSLCLESLAPHMQPALVVPVLRAGLAGLAAVRERWPGIAISPAGLSRNEDTLTPDWYLAPSLASHPAGSCVLVVETIVATGNTTLAVCERIAHSGLVPTVACILTARQGAQALNRAGVDVYTLGVDEHLDDRGYLVPGLGDAGDRWCGTPR